MLRELTVVGLDRLGADDAGDRYNLAVEFHLCPIGLGRHTALVTASRCFAVKYCRLDGRAFAEFGNTEEFRAGTIARYFGPASPAYTSSSLSAGVGTTMRSPVFWIVATR